MTPDPLLEACARALYEAHPLFGLGGLVSWGYLASSEQAERIEAAAAVIAVCRPILLYQAAAIADSVSKDDDSGDNRYDAGWANAATTCRNLILREAMVAKEAAE